MVSLFAGFFAGFLHVIAGPDHLAAVIPLVVRRPLSALQIGLRWGIGHALGVIILALLGLTLREQLDLDQISASAEQVVGGALILLGCWVISRREQLVIHSHTHEHRHGGHPIKKEETSAHQHLHIHQGPIDHDAPSAHRPHSHTPSWMGLLHGLAGASHLFALIPSLALPLTQALIYLCAYLVASVVAMSGFAHGLGRVASRVTPRALQRLSDGSAGGAIAIGLFWLFAH